MLTISSAYSAAVILGPRNSLARGGLPKLIWREEEDEGGAGADSDAGAAAKTDSPLRDEDGSIPE